MSVEFKTGDLFTSTCEAWVNPVNCVGVSGKGLAKAFAKKFPGNQVQYERHCNLPGMLPGAVFTTSRLEPLHPRWILNVATKDHWRHPSEMHWVVLGLQYIKKTVKELGIQSIAIPALGCGNGGLAWVDVSTVMEKLLKDLPDCRVEIYEPGERV